jgi:hypothetical protein
VFVDELPRNATGKVLKRELVEQDEEDSGEGESQDGDAGKGKGKDEGAETENAEKREEKAAT